MAGELSVRDRLRDDDARVRLGALETLTVAPDISYRGELVRLCMDDRSGPNRLQAARALRHYWPDAQVIRVYSSRVTDELPVAAEIISILGRIGDTRAVDLLEKAYHTAKEAWVKLKVLSQMHCASEARVHEFLKKTGALTGQDERIRAAAVALVGKLENPSAIRVVLSRVRDRSPRVRANALEAIGARFAGVEAARVMARFVADPHHRVRSVAIKFLLLYGVKSAEDHLRVMVESTEALCRAAAAWVMREVKPTRQMAEWIKKLLNDGSEMVAGMAQAAAERIGRRATV